MELLLTGERVDAARAEAMRLVWKVVEHDQLLAAANDLATRLCQSAPLAVRATKEVAHRTRSMPWIEAVRFGETMRKVANQTDDAAEARRGGRRGPAARLARRVGQRAVSFCEPRLAVAVPSSPKDLASNVRRTVCSASSASASASESPSPRM